MKGITQQCITWLFVLGIVTTVILMICVFAFHDFVKKVGRKIEDSIDWFFNQTEGRKH